VSHFLITTEGIEFQHDPNVHDGKILTRYDSDTAFSMKKLSNAGMLNKTEGTWCFWSPQMCSGETFSGFAADMWAAGICLYIFVSGKLPFYSEFPTDLFKSIQQDDVPLKGMGFSDSLVDLLKATLNKDPDERAGVGDCLRHPFLHEAREQRVTQLSVAFDRCRKRNLIVNEDDIRKVRSWWLFRFKIERQYSLFALCRLSELLRLSILLRCSGRLRLHYEMALCQPKRIFQDHHLGNQSARRVKRARILVRLKQNIAAHHRTW
jgi:serine/threonine protein kinase